MDLIQTCSYSAWIAAFSVSSLPTASAANIELLTGRGKFRQLQLLDTIPSFYNLLANWLLQQIREQVDSVTGITCFLFCGETLVLLHLKSTTQVPPKYPPSSLHAVTTNSSAKRYRKVVMVQFYSFHPQNNTRSMLICQECSCNMCWHHSTG